MPLKLKQLPLDLDLQAPHALEGFIGGDNLLLRALITQQAAGLGESQLFLHGAANTGKTHLAQAACFFASQMGRTAAYVPLKLACAQLNQIGFEPCDLVVLDDVDALVGQAANEFLLFDLINRLREQHTPLLLTARLPPAALGFELPDLASRLAWGVTLAISSPNDAEKIEFMRRKAQERGFDLPFETAVYLLQRCPRDIGSLLAMIQALDHASLSAQRKISIPFVRSVFFSDESH
ncbi:MAG: DnaA regulatory inactivator Hda [Halothiobacillus sp. 24-54-40]|jgi:DnaA family protein|nr:MAG: DnaA regulatory inactivator Hda [Halothiobacillus sp. 35-54-62]OYZ87928.1 MAG: DnaA regulatory inactivator Hda [Halothiobacillus sp. 24-54-40]OZA81453.1 MAG: DnaA regulatory inactivator Hda [Halothiobacillus sp. 39-53-45]